jgi:hypothetical protein
MSHQVKREGGRDYEGLHGANEWLLRIYWMLLFANDLIFHLGTLWLTKDTK